jgi:hypothetical protein
MTFIKNSLVLLFFSLLFFSGCKNDLNLNAPYKEIPSIYAVLNPFESIQMIRINKVFLGVGDANQMAKIADSVNYQPDEITVTLKHSSNPHIITFRDSVVQTADGAFNTTQRVYVSFEKLDSTGTYTLIVKNNHTGNVFTASASPIDRVNANQGYGPLSPPYYPYPSGANSGFINYSAVSPTITVGSVLFQPVDRAQIYQVVIRSHFYNDLGATKTYDFVDYVFNDVKTTRLLSGTTYINVTFKSVDYFSNIGLGLSSKNLGSGALGRKMWLMEYFVYASTQEYVDYIQFSQPSLSLNQNKPLYSNFDKNAALGIFTFRSSCIAQKELDPVFVNAFSYNPYTCNYNFYDSNNRIEGCR